MLYRGVRYELRARIVRREWRVAVYINEEQPVERTIKGSRADAEFAVRAMIDRLLGIASGQSKP